MAGPFRVLVADDDPACLALLKTQLTEWGYQPEAHADGMEAWLAMEAEDPPAMALLDWLLPGMDGAEICRKVREAPREPRPYVLLLTARSSLDHLTEGFAAGADDFIAKPFHLGELRARLDAGRRIVELNNELIEARETLLLKATTDALTGIWNRPGILDILGNELARRRRQPAPMALMLADLDRFKAINDQFGHAAGDAALIEAARRLKGSLRSYDAIGRYGGEEFLIVMPGCPAEAANVRAEALRRSLDAAPVLRRGQPEIPISASFGLVVLEPGEDAPADAVIRAADRALYRAKANGRNRVEAEPASGGGEGAD